MKRQRRSPHFGWFDTIAGAFLGAGIGLVTLFASLGLLWWNEGRVDPSVLARRAVVASAERPDPALDDQLVSVTHIVAVRAGATDPEFLRPADHVTLDRVVEMYAWTERDRGDRTGYTYARGWTAHPQDSRRFRDPRGHENPAMRFRARTFAAASASLGPYSFHPEASGAPPGAPVALTADLLDPGAPAGAVLDAGYVYLGDGSAARPVVGDLRISYQAYDPGEQATLFGQQHGAAVGPHHAGATRFHRLLRGPREAAIARLATEHRAATWLLRAVGFALLWLALNLALAPINAMLDIVPALGRAGRSLVAAVTLPIAFGLTVAVALVASIAHSALAMALLVVALVAVAVLWRRHPPVR